MVCLQCIFTLQQLTCRCLQCMYVHMQIIVHYQLNIIIMRAVSLHTWLPLSSLLWSLLLVIVTRFLLRSLQLHRYNYTTITKCTKYAIFVFCYYTTYIASQFFMHETHQKGIIIVYTSVKAMYVYGAAVTNIYSCNYMKLLILM